MPLFYFFIIFVNLNIQQWDTLYYTNLYDAGDVGACIMRFKVSIDFDHFPLGLEPNQIISSTGPYLNVRQPK